MRFAKLFDECGLPIKEPVTVPGSVSFDARTGEAQAWGADGVTLLASMVKARVAWMTAAGTRLEGMEPVEGPAGLLYRAMEWHLLTSANPTDRSTENLERQRA